MCSANLFSRSPLFGPCYPLASSRRSDPRLTFRELLFACGLLFASCCGFFCPLVPRNYSVQTPQVCRPHPTKGKSAGPRQPNCGHVGTCNQPFGPWPTEALSTARRRPANESPAQSRYGVVDRADRKSKQPPPSGHSRTTATHAGGGLILDTFASGSSRALAMTRRTVVA